MVFWSCVLVWSLFSGGGGVTVNFFFYYYLSQFNQLEWKSGVCGIMSLCRLDNKELKSFSHNDSTFLPLIIKVVRHISGQTRRSSHLSLLSSNLNDVDWWHRWMKLEKREKYINSYSNSTLVLYFTMTIGLSNGQTKNIFTPFLICF